MATNPAGKGTKIIGVYMNAGMEMEPERRAESMQISTGTYCRISIGQRIESGKMVELKENWRRQHVRY